MSTFVEKVLKAPAGSVVTVEPDLFVINDGVSSAAVPEIATVAAPDKVVVVYDHDVPTGRPEAAAVLRRNLAFAQKYGLKYVQAVGCGYLWILREVVRPGQIIIGGGSHGSIYGAAGALGIDVSVPELARAVETGRYSTVVPETTYITLTGSLKKGCSIMDAAYAALKAAGDISRRAVEIYAPQLFKREEEVLLSIMTMTGAFAASMAQERPIGGVEIDLSKVEPMAMLPCGKREDQKKAPVDTVASLGEMKINAGQIGGYTGGTIEELRHAAGLMEGKKLALGFRLTVCPATSEDYIAAMEEGIITKFIDFGAQISAAGDHSVVVQGAGAMGPKEKLLTTGLYTFAGCMGSDEAQIYSVSVDTVMQAAFAGKL